MMLCLLARRRAMSARLQVLNRVKMAIVLSVTNLLLEYASTLISRSFAAGTAKMINVSVKE